MERKEKKTNTYSVKGKKEGRKGRMEEGREWGGKEGREREKEKKLLFYRLPRATCCIYFPNNHPRGGKSDTCYSSPLRPLFSPEFSHSCLAGIPEDPSGVTGLQRANNPRQSQAGWVLLLNPLNAMH